MNEEEIKQLLDRAREEILESIRGTLLPRGNEVLAKDVLDIVIELALTKGLLLGRLIGFQAGLEVATKPLAISCGIGTEQPTHDGTVAKPPSKQVE